MRRSVYAFPRGNGETAGCPGSAADPAYYGRIKNNAGMDIHSGVYVFVCQSRFFPLFKRTKIRNAAIRITATMIMILISPVIGARRSFCVLGEVRSAVSKYFMISFSFVG